MFIEREGERERERNQGRQESEREVSFGGYFLVVRIYIGYIYVYIPVCTTYLPPYLPIHLSVNNDWEIR